MLRRFRRQNEPDPEPAPEQPARDPFEPVVILGLGNPGGGYVKHRHNVGTWTVNRLAKRHGIEFTRRSGLVEMGEGLIDGRGVVLAKPRVFMNESGKAAQQALKANGMKTRQLLVIHDDLDMPVGRVRLRPKGSHGGNNGMRSVIGVLGTQEFPRLKIGIGRPVVDGEPSWEPEHVAAYVLAAPGPRDRELLEAAAERAADAVERMLADGIEAAMAIFNAK